MDTAPNTAHLTAPLWPACPPAARSDHEGSTAEEAQWAALERIQAQEQHWAAQQAAQREAREQARERALLQGRHPHARALEEARAALAAEQQRQREPTPVWTSRDELEGWFAAAGHAGAGPAHPAEETDEAALAAADHQLQQQQQQGQYAEQQLRGSEAGLAAGEPLPSPLTSATSNFDVAVARLLASAGNTPTGPLGHHRRTGAGAGRGAAGGCLIGSGVAVVVAPCRPAPTFFIAVLIPVPQPRWAARRARRWRSRWCCWSQSCPRRW